MGKRIKDKSSRTANDEQRRKGKKTRKRERER